jgi:hypothetical protein
MTMQFFGALRLANRLAQRPILLASARQLHTPRSFPRPFPTVYIFAQCHRRAFSIGSIFGRGNKPPSTPSPLTVATIAGIEADANANPHDIAKQLTLFQALVDTGVKPGYDIVVSRWERMCTFVSHISLLKRGFGNPTWHLLGSNISTAAFRPCIPAVPHSSAQIRSPIFYQFSGKKTGLHPQCRVRSSSSCRIPRDDHVPRCGSSSSDDILCSGAYPHPDISHTRSIPDFLPNDRTERSCR